MKDDKPAPPAHDPKNAPEIANAHFTHDTCRFAITVPTEPVMRLALPKSLTRRRVYAFLGTPEYIDAAGSTGAYDADLVFTLNGHRVITFPFGRRMDQLAQTDRVSVRLGAEPRNVALGATAYPGFQPAARDSLTVTFYGTGTPELLIPPWHLNITADEVFMVIREAVFPEATEGAFHGALAVQSEGMSQ